MSKYADRYAKIVVADIDRGTLRDLAPGEVSVGRLTDQQWRMWAAGRQLSLEVATLAENAAKALAEHEAQGDAECPNGTLCVALKTAMEAFERSTDDYEAVTKEFTDSVFGENSSLKGGGFSVRRDGNLVRLQPMKHVLYVELVDGPESLGVAGVLADLFAGRPYRGDLTKN